VTWLITRQKQTRSWLGDGSIWAPIIQDADWVDDTDPDNQMVDPFGASGHLYSNDGPGMMMKKPLTAGSEVVIKHRLRERVQVSFDGSTPSNNCSDLFFWHDFRSLRKDITWMERDSFGGNELVKGDKDWGSVPSTP
jgi:hypothetical protein